MKDVSLRDVSARVGETPDTPASWRDYVAIARPDHWIKNIFVLPGAALAIDLSPHVAWPSAGLHLLMGLFATCLIASANYTINEWLDGKSDRFHPVKRTRPGASGRLLAQWVYAEWLALAAVGLRFGWELGHKFFAVALVLLVMGLVYNVPPLRTKDRAYLDVVTESVNNPLRFMLGWTSIVANLLPPSSILVSFWMGGAYLMAVKRYSEFRFISNPTQAGLYRRSFQRYTEQSLLLSALYYALTSALCLGVFLIKYKIELILGIPFLALLFVWYLHLGMRHDSVAQRPERLYRERAFMLYVIGVGLLLMALLFVRIPLLDILVNSHVLGAQ